MNKPIITLILSVFLSTSFSIITEAQNGSSYNVVMARKPVKIDANWDKAVWRKVKIGRAHV